MKHYAIAQWADFARTLAPEEQRADMREHLAEGCSDCREIVDFCERLTTVCRAITGTEVPDVLTTQAWAIFPTSTPQKRALRIPVELLFDSFLAPAAPGLRASWQIGWQALYRAGECSVDIRVEPDLDSSRAAVIGQIANHLTPDAEMADMPVCLKAGKLIVAETRSNRFGEFQMEYEQQGRLQLCIFLDGGARCIQVPLKRLAAEKPAGTDRLNLGTRRRTRLGRQPRN